MGQMWYNTIRNSIIMEGLKMVDQIAILEVIKLLWDVILNRIRPYECKYNEFLFGMFEGLIILYEIVGWGYTFSVESNFGKEVASKVEEKLNKKA